MTTIINTPPSGNSSDSGLGLILGVLIAIGLVALFFVYGIPAIRKSQTPNNTTNIINIPVPTGATETPEN